MDNLDSPVQNHFKTMSRTKARRHEEIIFFILNSHSDTLEYH